jgi:FkbM family methyltransferase
MRKLLQKLARTAAGVHIVSQSRPGLELGADMSHRLPAVQVDVAFDVGGNHGQSAALFRQWFPRAVIHSFEPLPDTYAVLQQALASDRLARAHNLALGAESGSVAMTQEVSSDLARVTAPNDPTNGSTVTAERTTLDRFCREADIEHINLLKIDTEGHDLYVLEGARAMLAGNRIDVVQVEAGMNPLNTNHVHLKEFLQLLEPLGYFLFGVYEQVPEFPTGAPQLRRADLAFVSQQAIAANTALYAPAGKYAFGVLRVAVFD